jgi:hypothetical protein
MVVRNDGNFKCNPVAGNVFRGKSYEFFVIITNIDVSLMIYNLKQVARRTKHRHTCGLHHHATLQSKDKTNE